MKHCPYYSDIDGMSMQCALLSLHGISKVAGVANPDNSPCQLCQSQWQNNRPPEMSDSLPDSLQAYLTVAIAPIGRLPVFCRHGGEFLGGGCCGHAPYWECQRHGEATSTKCVTCADWLPKLREKNT